MKECFCAKYFAENDYAQKMYRCTSKMYRFEYVSDVIDASKV